MAHSNRATNKAKRGGLTRNQQRKKEYAQMAEASHRKGGNQQEPSGTSKRTSMAGRRNNHNRGQLKLDKEVRRAEAKARQAFYDNLSLQQRWDALDMLFGKGKGAAKERYKILKKLQEKTLPVTSPHKEAVTPGLTPQASKQVKKEQHDKKAREARNGR